MTGLGNLPARQYAPGTGPLFEIVGRGTAEILPEGDVITDVHLDDGTCCEADAGPSLEVILERAGQAFWSQVAAHFPDATTGDLDPGTATAFERAAGTAVLAWIEANVGTGYAV